MNWTWSCADVVAFACVIEIVLLKTCLRVRLPSICVIVWIEWVRLSNICVVIGSAGYAYPVCVRSCPNLVLQLGGLLVRKRYRGTSELILDTDSEGDELREEDTEEDESSDVDGKKESFGYEEARRRSLELNEEIAPSTYEIWYNSRFVPEQEGAEKISSFRQPTLVTWVDPKDGRVYTDILTYVPLAAHVQTPPSLECSLATILVDEDQFLVVGEQLELYESILDDHTQRLDTLPPTLFEGYDRDLKEFFTPKTAEEVVARERERKARTTLLMALQEDHLAKFHKMADAKEMWEAIESRFGGNDESKKMQKYLLKQQFEGLSLSTSEGTTASSSSNIQNVAFVSADNTSSTNDVSTAYSVSSHSVSKSHKEGSSSYTDEVIYSFFANESSAPQLNCDDLEQISDDDLEEMDLKWQDDSKALVTIDGEDIDCSGHVEEDTQNYAMMAYFSRNSGSDNESVFMNKECDLENTPVNDRYAEGMHATLADVSDSKPVEYASNESDSSVETTTSIPAPVDNAPKIVCGPKVWIDAPIIEDYESDSDDDSVENVKEIGTTNHYPKIEKQDRHSHTGKVLGYTRKACFVYGSFSHLIKDYDFYGMRMAKQAALTKSKDKDDPHKALKDKGIVDSGCSRHMTGNKGHLADYQEFKGGSVAFGGSNGRITGKGKIKAGSFKLKNIDPSGDLSCFFAKASIDESNKWHRRLGHVNFKNLNKLMKGNLVRGLPSKIFENNHTCVAYQKGKQHKASWIKREYSNARTLQQNGVAERKNMTLIEAARTMLADSFLSTTFWAEAVNTACYVLNRILGTKLENKTPYELLTSRQPIISYLIPFGCHVTILNTIDQLGKFDGKSDLGFLVGYSLNSKAFWVYNLETKRVEENLHKELKKLKRQEKEANDAFRKETTHENQNANTNNTNLLNVVSTPISTAGPSIALNDDEPLYLDDPLMPHLEDIYVSPSKGIFTDSSYDDEGVLFRQEVKCIRIMKLMLLIQAIRIFLAFASYMGFIVYQIDVKSAFLYGAINEEVYVTQPPSFVDPKFPNKVYKVVKALYGLHQAPKAWYATLSTFLEKSRHRRGAIDNTLFIKQDKKDIMLVQVYVDDIIFGSTKKSWCDKFEDLVKNRFQMSSMGELTFFLGLQTASTLIETQQPLVKDEEAADVDYLKGQPKLGLWYPKVSSFNLEAYSDSDYAGANLDKKSTIGDAYEKKLIQVLEIHTDDNVADLLTKAFDVSRFKFLVINIGLLNLNLHWLRGSYMKLLLPSIDSVVHIHFHQFIIMSNINNNMQTQTSNSLHNAIMEAGSKDRPPMLAPGNYIHWKSRIKRYIDTKPNRELIHFCLTNPPYELGWKDKFVVDAEGNPTTITQQVFETYKNVPQEIRDQLNTEAEAVQIILTGIDNDIYSTVDACPNACEMWKAIERLKQGESINVQDLETNLFWEFRKFTSLDGESLESYYSRFYKMMNELTRNQCKVTNHQVNVQFLLQLQQEWQRFVTLMKQSQELKHNSSIRTHQSATRKREKAVVNSPQPIYDQEPSMVDDDEDTSKEKEIDKLMALISLSFKKIYKPTNNNLRTMNKVVVTEDIIRQDLHLDNADGVECLPTKDIFAELARIVLITNQEDDLFSHTTKYTSPALTQKVFANMRRIGKGFLGVETPLFATMLVQPQAAAEEEDETCTTLSHTVTALEQDKVTQALEIYKLRRRVKTLEKKRRGCIQIGGRIEAIDANEDITLVDMETEVDLGAELQGRLEEKDEVNASAKEVNASAKEVNAAERTVFNDDEMAKRLHDEEVEQAAAREKQEQDDFKRAQELQQQKYQSLNRKPISVAQARKNMIVFLKNMAGYKMAHFKGITYDQEMSKEDVKNMLQIVPVSEFKVEALQVKVGEITQAYQSFKDMVKDFDREDQDALWRLVKEKFSTAMPTEDKEKALWGSCDEDLHGGQQTKEQKEFGYILQVIKKLELKKLDDLLDGVDAVQRL
nr:retrovirus-related Pol polyprotein from transposon TNT 1-94 [Tanacetum cinerariifolium]